MRKSKALIIEEISKNKAKKEISDLLNKINK